MRRAVRSRCAHRECGPKAAGTVGRVPADERRRSGRIKRALETDELFLFTTGETKEEQREAIRVTYGDMHRLLPARLI